MAEGFLLDTAMTPELKEEGLVREFVRGIQELRKSEGLTPSDKITLLVSAGDVGKKFIEANKDVISKATLVKEFEFAENEGKNIDLEDMQFIASVRK